MMTISLQLLYRMRKQRTNADAATRHQPRAVSSRSNRWRWERPCRHLARSAKPPVRVRRFRATRQRAPAVWVRRLLLLRLRPLRCHISACWCRLQHCHSTVWVSRACPLGRGILKYRRHRIHKCLDTLLANQTARRAMPPTIANRGQRKMADCPSYY